MANSVKMDDKWETENDMRTLEQAAVIMGDKKRMAKAGKMMEEKMTAMSKMMNTEEMSKKMFNSMDKK